VEQPSFLKKRKLEHASVLKPFWCHNFWCGTWRDQKNLLSVCNLFMRQLMTYLSSQRKKTDHSWNIFVTIKCWLRPQIWLLNLKILNLLHQYIKLEMVIGKIMWPSIWLSMMMYRCLLLFFCWRGQPNILATHENDI